MSIPIASTSTALALPNSTALTGQMLNDLTKALGVARTSLASDTQIAHAWSNLPRLLEKIPPHHRNETMVRMCVAVSTGLFDAAINYIWNSAVTELRDKVRSFGLTVVHHVTGNTFDEDSLLDLKDADLLNLCLKLNLISEDGFFFLDQCRATRNNFSAAHPSMGTLDEDEFLNFLSRCAKHALSNEYNARGVDIPAFIAAIKASSFTQEQLNTWIQRLQQTFDAQRNALFGTFHGIYCDPASGEEARQNAIKVFAPFKTTLSPRVQSDLIDRHQEYKAKGDDKRSKASLQFFENLGLLALLGDAELHAIFTTASSNLLTVHNAMNNFYNEPPFARRLAEIMNGSAVPASAQYAVVEAVTTCAIGNPYGVSNAAVPSYDRMIRSFSPNEVAILLNFGSQPKTVIGQRINNYPSCRKRFAALTSMIAASSVPTQSKAQYDFWAAEAKK
ncbi:hypothetical protein [Bradyrhizobium sp. WSM3983]|uniref:hypothetical protein n=1 Tax=Bradyrhizobium sp. WSM3983 TaxID=1038867 RepID=UPI0004857EF1|nr:hypothetical protein [Bradyrhizobium sp. WSM3983]